MASPAAPAAFTASSPASPVSASTYADRLRQAADLLEAQGASSFRVNAYRNAADAITGLDQAALVAIADTEGIEGLDRLPCVGRGIAAALLEMIRTGRWSQLERLRGNSDPVLLFTTVPGLGHRLAERIHEELHIDTLEALEIAAHDGRLEGVPGVGPRRAAAIRANLHAMLSRGRVHRSPAVSHGPPPPVGTLLAVDRQYRERAAAGLLSTIAPSRFNPANESWLPVLHSELDGWQFTAFFSNTAQAHQLNRTRDWVLLFHYDAENREGQHTIVTETHGALTGRRVVRGRENECRRYYAVS